MAKPKHADTRDKLQVSRRRLQNEGMRGQVDLTTFKLARRGHASIEIRERILTAEIERTIEGASTLTVTVSDADKRIQRSGRLVDKCDTKVDGLWFRLVSVEKSGPELTLVFEDREVAVLRTYTKKLIRNRAKVTRAQFAKIMAKEVKEFNLPFVCPELRVVQPIKTSKDRLQDWQKDEQREAGFPEDINKEELPLGVRRGVGGHRTTPAGDSVRVKRVKADKDQLKNIGRVLDVGISMNARTKVLIASIMCITQESSCRNLVGGHLDSVGLFQQRRSQGWPASRDIEKDAHEFFKRAIDVDQDLPNLDHWKIVQTVQRSANGKLYDQWKEEATHTVSLYGAGSDSKFLRDQNMQNWDEQDNAYLYTRGTPDETQADGWKEEDSWSCLQRLADEVNWRAYMVSGTLYFISEKRLFKSRARMKFTEKSAGIDWIDYDYDVGRKDLINNRQESVVTVTAHVARWEAPPGSVIWIAEKGPVEGKWLVSSISRSLFDNIATITCKKPRPKLPEPAEDSIDLNTGVKPGSLGSGLDSSAVIDTSGGAKSIVDSAVRIAEKAGGSGIYVGSSLRSGDKLPSGNYSDHAENNESRAARDIGVRGINLLTGPPSPKLDKAVVAIGEAFGQNYDSSEGGLGLRGVKFVVNRIIDGFDFEDYKIQILWRTPLYGGHMGHIHIGCHHKDQKPDELS
jgi:hypothetical protein